MHEGVKVGGVGCRWGLSLLLWVVKVVRLLERTGSRLAVMDGEGGWVD